jgi:hypothetical protein
VFGNTEKTQIKKQGQTPGLRYRLLIKLHVQGFANYIHEAYCICCVYRKAAGSSFIQAVNQIETLNPTSSGITVPH